MRVEATYDAGRLVFARPLRLKRESIRVLVEIPDDAIDGTSAYDDVAPDVRSIAVAERKRLDAGRAVTLPPDDDLPELSEAKRGRWDAFAMRAFLREASEQTQ